MMAAAAGAALLCFGGAAEAAGADVGYAVHAEGAAARMVGDRKVDQFGWGAAGLIAPELTIGDYIGFELPLGGVALSDGTVDEPGMADTGPGYAILAAPGVRIRPFGRDPGGDLFSADGLWLAASAGMAFTGSVVRPAFTARLGYDLCLGPASEGRFGPYAGYMQIVETQSEAMPEDARVVLVGLHGSFEPAPAADVPSEPAPEPAPRASAERKAEAIPDRDADGLPTIADLCPNDPEHAGDEAVTDGCPHQDHARVEGNEIVLDDRVYFRLNSADVEFRSWNLLESVSKLLLAQPQYALVRVQGHADDTGDGAYNQRLSVSRAQAVRAMLIRFGVPGDRLTVEGFGQSRPAVAGRSEGARTKNRRVEFLILQRSSIDGVPVSRNDASRDTDSDASARPSELVNGKPRAGNGQRHFAPEQEARHD
jgi:outer membrane protein OmpA-like peptidoglycan-associated protein